MDASTGTAQPSGEAPAIHLVNLDRSTVRLAEFNRRNAHLPLVTRYPAVDGSLIDREELIRRGIVWDDCPYSAGTLGCALSHIGLWEMAIAENRPITVFEDDVVAEVGFVEQANALLQSAPTDWDFVGWGCILEFKAWIDFGTAKAKMVFYDIDNAQSPNVLGPGVKHQLFRLLNMFGTVAYSVSPKGARILIDTCLPLRKRAVDFQQPGVSFWDEGIDCPMNDAYGRMNAFMCFPPLVRHDPPADAASDRKDIPVG